jgi:hypothetical protein
MVQKLFYVLLFVATMLVAMLSFPLIMVGYALLIAYALIKGSWPCVQIGSVFKLIWKDGLNTFPYVINLIKELNENKSSDLCSCFIC